MKASNQNQLSTQLEGIRHLLSHLHGEVATLEESYSEVLDVLRRLEGVATRDDLTGLLRRSPFFQKWQVLLDECRKLNENCGVLMIDIDHFKLVNDTHGHPTGDEVIKKVAELLKTYESPNCVVARYGGEEFAVAIRGTDAELLGVAEMIRRQAERLHGPVIGKGGTVDPKVEWKCTLSIGVSTSRGTAGFSAPQLLQTADAALYDAKRKGRNRVRTAA